MKSSLLILSVLATVALASFPSRFLQVVDPPNGNDTSGNQTEPAYCIPEEELLAMLGPN
jgi:hypothetical protein